MEKYFVNLGGNFLLNGICDKLHEFGYKVIIIDWNENPPLKGDIHLQVDVKDAELCIQKLKELNVKIDGCVNCIDIAVPTANAINKWCGNKVMPEAFNTVLTKEHMRDCWMRDGIFNRVSRRSDDISVQETYEINKTTKLIIKPNVAASSRGITILEAGQTKKAVEEAYALAKDKSWDGHALIEEFVEGRESTIDMLGDDYGNVSVYAISVKYHTVNAIHNRVATKIHWNSNVYSEDLYRRIAEMGKKAYRSIGLKNSFGHLEMITKPDGTFSPVEIGARSSGFICSHLVSWASERDYLGDYIKMLKGEAIDNFDHINSGSSAMWYGYDIPKNTDSVCESNLAKFLPSGIEVGYSKRDGLLWPNHFGDMIDDNSRDHYGYEMIHGSKDVLTIDAILKAQEQFLDEFLGRKRSTFMGGGCPKSV